MPRLILDLNKTTDLKLLEGQWKVATGLVPGEYNEGLQSQLLDATARQVEYDDSGWAICNDIRHSLSEGFTFAWYRLNLIIPDEIGASNISQYRVFFETNFDNYGEVWIDGDIDRNAGVISGINSQQRVEIDRSQVRDGNHLIACLVVNGPLAKPRGGIFIRYAYLAFELTDD